MIRYFLILILLYTYKIILDINLHQIKSNLLVIKFF